MGKIILGSLTLTGLLFASSVQYDAQCASCHGAKGNESLAGNPIIVGLGEAKLAKMLKDFKSGALKGENMNGIAGGLSNADIAEISKYAGSFK